MNTSATDIYQEFLDECSKSFFERDFETVAHMMVYPHTMETLDGRVYFDRPEMMIEAGRDFRDYLERMQTRDYFRICKTATFDPGSTTHITGTHDTYMLQSGGYVVNPIPSEMTLQFEDGRWKGAGIRALVDNVSVNILSPSQLSQRAAARDERSKEK